RLAGSRRALRAAALALRLLERCRADRGDGRAAAAVARRAPPGPAGAQRARLPRARPAAGHDHALLLARRGARAGRGLHVLVGVGIGLTQTQRGLFGTVGHDVSQLVDPNATVPSNAPGRLTSAGSVRARYWREAFEIFGDHPAVGVGAGGYATVRSRYRNDTLQVRHA